MRPEIYNVSLASSPIAQYTHRFQILIVIAITITITITITEN